MTRHFRVCPVNPYPRFRVFFIPLFSGECRQTSSHHERNYQPDPAGVADVHLPHKTEVISHFLAVMADFIAPDRSEMTVVATNSFLFFFADR